MMHYAMMYVPNEVYAEMVHGHRVPIFATGLLGTHCTLERGMV